MSQHKEDDMKVELNRDTVLLIAQLLGRKQWAFDEIPSLNHVMAELSPILKEVDDEKERQED